MPLFTPQTAEQVEQGFQDYGATPGGKAMMRAEMRAAEEAIASKVYITWRSERSGADCARVSSESRCFCNSPGFSTRLSTPPGALRELRSEKASSRAASMRSGGKRPMVDFRSCSLRAVRIGALLGSPKSTRDKRVAASRAGR